jgi:hypothetical protein
MPYSAFASLCEKLGGESLRVDLRRDFTLC